MEKRWRVLGTLLLAASCVLCLLAPALAASRKTTYFTAVNDTVLELRDDTMPFLSSGELYVPYTVFDPNAIGIQLGVFASYGSNVVILYGRKTGVLVFDLSQDTVTSSTGIKYSKRAIRHNSTIFVPVDMVANYFGLDWSILVDRDYGWVVRVKNSAAQIQDRDFLSQGKYILESRYNTYLKGKYLEEPSSPLLPLPPIEQPGTVPELPHPSSEDPQPTPTQGEPPQLEGGDVYVAVRCTSGGNTAALAAALGRQTARGVFFFPADELTKRDGEVRALAAAGHKIGLLLDGETPEARQAQSEQGSRLLAHILRAGTDMALTAEGAELPEGWLAWPAAVDGTAGDRTSAQQMEDILGSAVRPEDCFLLLDDSTQTAGLSSRLLEQMAEEGCTFLLALEPMLAG